MKKIGYLVASAAIAAAAPALAQDSPAIGGARVEATVGWDRTVLRLDGDSVGKSGVVFGGEVGYDFQVGSGTTIGGYAGIDGASTRECEADGTERVCLKAGRNFTIGARVGARIATTGLAYLKGGYSNGQLRASYTDTAFPADNESGTANMDGFHVGAGVQLPLSGRLYGKAEYNYTRYSTYDVFGSDFRTDRHRVVVGVGIGF